MFVCSTAACACVALDCPTHDSNGVVLTNLMGVKVLASTGKVPGSDGTGGSSGCMTSVGYHGIVVATTTPPYYYTNNITGLFLYCVCICSLAAALVLGH